MIFLIFSVRATESGRWERKTMKMAGGGVARSETFNIQRSTSMEGGKSMMDRSSLRFDPARSTFNAQHSTSKSGARSAVGGQRSKQRSITAKKHSTLNVEERGGLRAINHEAEDRQQTRNARTCALLPRGEGSKNRK
jgi:hypothetical protein